MVALQSYWIQNLMWKDMGKSRYTIHVMLDLQLLCVKKHHDYTVKDGGICLFTIGEDVL